MINFGNNIQGQKSTGMHLDSGKIWKDTQSLQNILVYQQLRQWEQEQYRLYLTRGVRKKLWKTILTDFYGIHYLSLRKRHYCLFAKIKFLKKCQMEQKNEQKILEGKDFVKKLKKWLKGYDRIY